MKNTFKVKLNKIISIKDFANMASGFESDIDIISGRYTGDAKSIRVCTASLRRKLESSKEGPKYIFTEVGIGYRFRDFSD